MTPPIRRSVVQHMDPRRPPAPPVYRPTQASPQRKAVAPPVYRPTQASPQRKPAAPFGNLVNWPRNASIQRAKLEATLDSEFKYRGDTDIQFTRYKLVDPTAEKLESKQTGKVTKSTSVLDPLGKAEEEGRLGPKNSAKTVSRVTLVKFSGEREAHWELQCQIDGSKKGTVKYMKIDLMKDAYRIMYGSQTTKVLKPKLAIQELHFNLPQKTPVRELYKVFVKIAQQRGKWTGTDDYNCQDFAIAMLTELKVNESEMLLEAAKWRDQNR